jgi:hypothetical protein
MLDLGRPEDDRNGEREAQPKLIAKHRHGVTGAPVMAYMGVLAVIATCFGRMFVVLVGHAIIGDSVSTIQRPFGHIDAYAHAAAVAAIPGDSSDW